jgi:phosphoribosylaminoimidazole (AIR) synthetase
MNSRKYFFLVFTTIAISYLFSSCKEDTEYKGIVKVSIIDTLDIKMPVAYCELVFGDTNYANDVKRTEYTDISGTYEGIWTKDVSLKVVATKEIDSVLYTGSSSLKVKTQGAEPVEIIFKQEKK